MKIITLKRPDGYDVYLNIQSISHWTKSIYDSYRTDVFVGGQKIGVMQTTGEICKLIEECK